MEADINNLLDYLDQPQAITQLQQRVTGLEGQVQSLLDRENRLQRDLESQGQRMAQLEQVKELERRSSEDKPAAQGSWKVYGSYLCTRRKCPKTASTCYDVHWPAGGPRFYQEIHKIQRRRSLKASATLLTLLQSMRDCRCYNNLLRLVAKLQKDLLH